LSTEIKLEGEFELLCAKAKNGLRVKLTRLKKKHKALNAALGGQATVTGLTDTANEILKESLPEAPEFWEKIESLPKPSEYLQSELEQALKSKSSTTQSLIDIVLGKSEGEEITNLVVERAIGASKDLVDSVLPMEQLEDSEQAAYKVLDAILKKLGRPVDREEPAYKKAHAKLKNKIKSLNDDITQQWKDWQTDLSSNVKEKIIQPLAAIGEDLEQLKTKLDSKWQEILAPVKKFVTAYQEKRSKLIKLLEKHSNTEINLNIAFESSASDSTQADLEIVILENNQLTQSVYDGLWRGDLTDIGNKIGEASKQQSIEVKSLKLLSGFESEKKIGVTFSIFGAEFSWSQRKLMEMEFEQGASNEILVARSKAEIKTAFIHSGETKTSSSLLSFVARHPDEESGVKFSASYSHEDEDLTDDEVRSYFKTYEKLSLISLGTTDEVLGDLGGSTTASNKKKRKAEMVSHVVIGQDTFDRWCNTELDGEKVYNHALKAWMDVTVAFAPMTRNFNNLITDIYENDIDRLKLVMPVWNDTNFSKIDAKRFLKKTKSELGIELGAWSNSNTIAKRIVSFFEEAHEQANQFTDLFAVWREADSLIEDIKQKKVKLKNSKSKMKKLNERYHKALDGWIVSPVRFSFKEGENKADQVPTKFLALPLALRYVAGNDKTKVRVIAELSVKDEATKFYS
ncbi:MAG: hypothetical protein OQK04_20305, partial [Kangiellaceae bacterium]|nr:hypothetical protein [Kangiellaceae bacterium]